MFTFIIKLRNNMKVNKNKTLSYIILINTYIADIKKNKKNPHNYIIYF